MQRRRMLAVLASPLIAALAGSAARAKGHGGPGGPGGPKGAVVNGTVTSVTATGFVVHSHGHGPNGYDVTVSTTSSTVYQKGGAAGQSSDVTVGVAVQVKGTVDSSGVVTATRVLIKGADSGDGTEVSGGVSSVSAGGFVVHPKAKRGVQPPDVNVVVGTGTTFSKGGAVATLADVVVGSQVEVKGTLDSSGNLVATTVSIESEDAGGDAEAEGTVASVNSSGFVVHPKAKHGVQPPDVNVVTNASTVFTKADGTAGTLADVIVGASVEVKGTIDSGSGSLVAATVKIEGADD